MRAKRGFSIIELLVVLVVIGVLIGIGTPSLAAWRASSAVAEAASLIEREVERVRIEARMASEPRSLEFVAGEIVFDADGRTVRLPSGVVVASVTPTGTVTFEGPFGTLDSSNSIVVEVAWAARQDEVRRQVRLVGVLGRVVVR